MPLRFKVDEDLPSDIAAILREASHDAISVHDQSLGGMTDDQLWPIVQREGRCRVTADKGFANAQRHPPGSHAGVVLLRLPHESRSGAGLGGYIHLMRAFLASGMVEEVGGAITSLTPDAIRIHRA